MKKGTRKVSVWYESSRNKNLVYGNGRHAFEFVVTVRVTLWSGTVRGFNRGLLFSRFFFYFFRGNGLSWYQIYRWMGKEDPVFFWELECFVFFLWRLWVWGKGSSCLLISMLVLHQVVCSLFVWLSVPCSFGPIPWSSLFLILSDSTIFGLLSPRFHNQHLADILLGLPFLWSHWRFLSESTLSYMYLISFVWFNLLLLCLIRAHWLVPASLSNCPSQCEIIFQWTTPDFNASMTPEVYWNLCLCYNVCMIKVAAQVPSWASTVLG